MAKGRIMIVDDEVLIAMNMRSELSIMGFEICELVTTGEVAIKNMEQEKPDLILMDIILNGKINGIDAAREIRSRYEIPIIFMTGCEDEGTIKLANKAAGPVEYLIKPIELEDFKLAIDKVLQRHKKATG